MATEQPGFVITVPAAGDLSAKQFYFMELDSNGRVAACDANTDYTIGVLQNKPSAIGQAAEVMVSGISKVSGDADLAKGNLIGPSADGQAAAYAFGSDTTKFIVGIVLEDNGAAAGLVTALISCVGAPRGA
jgi:hypothetical protein